jgi:hypothetical protein
MAPCGRRNAAILSPNAGERTPDGMKKLLSIAAWDRDGVRDDVREFVVERNARRAVLVLSA